MTDVLDDGTVPPHPAGQCWPGCPTMPTEVAQHVNRLLWLYGVPAVTAADVSAAIGHRGPVPLGSVVALIRWVARDWHPRAAGSSV